jgi:hypothetical protein
VLGEFADNSEEGIIPLSWINLAVERWKQWAKTKADSGGKRTMGIDVARAGSDKTVLALRNALAIVSIRVVSKLSMTSLAGLVESIADGRYLHIETDGGLGASLYDILKADGVPNLRPITVGGGTNFKDRAKELVFANLRAAMWWNLREMLDPSTGVEVCLPPIDLLISDLSTPTWEITRNATVLLESKESIAKKIGRSTDYGDAVCLAFWNTSTGGGYLV